MALSNLEFYSIAILNKQSMTRKGGFCRGFPPLTWRGNSSAFLFLQDALYIGSHDIFGKLGSGGGVNEVKELSLHISVHSLVMCFLMIRAR